MCDRYELYHDMVMDEFEKFCLRSRKRRKFELSSRFHVIWATQQNSMLQSYQVYKNNILLKNCGSWEKAKEMWLQTGLYMRLLVAQWFAIH